MIRRGVSRAAVPSNPGFARHWEAPASLAWWWMYSTRSVGSCFQGTRRGVGQSPGPGGGSHSGPVRNRTCLAMYSTTAVECVSCCLKGPTKLWSETLRCSAICATALCFLGGAGGTRTHNPRLLKHVLQTAVGLCSMGDEVMARGLLSYQGIESGPWAGVEPATSRAIAARSHHVLQPAVALLFLIKAQRGSCRDVHLTGGCSPGRQLGVLLRPSNEARGSDVRHREKM
jgi:hypothetical protein